MEFDTYTIHKENQKGNAMLQITFDEDYNLPDYKPDIAALILKQGRISVEEVTVTAGYVTIKGGLYFDVLYRSEQNSLGFCSVSGNLAFQERAVVDQAKEFDTASVDCCLEDLSIQITNSRKLAVRGVIQMQVGVTEFATVAIPCGCDSDTGVEILKEETEYLQLKGHGRDQCRIHEEIELPANKLNVHTLIWRQVQLEDLVCESQAGCIRIKGELAVFCLYQGEPGIRMDWFETRFPIQCQLDVAEATTDRICYGKVTGTEWNLQVREDEEGENRVLTIDGSVLCEYRIYQEEKTERICDLYGLQQDLVLERTPVCLESLLVKNNSRCKVADILTLEQGKKEILQICHCSGEIQLDRQELREDCILTEGVIRVKILYLTQEDTVPIDAIEGLIPFQYEIEVYGMTPDCRYELGKGVSMLSVTLKNSSTLEVQAMLDFPVIVFAPEQIDTISGVKVEPLSMDELLELPGVTGIRVKAGDTLWSIAKENHTTRAAIRQTNETAEEPLRPGSVLLLLKQVEG